VLANFDIFSLAGANTALVRSFATKADGNGQIVIQFTTLKDNRKRAASKFCVELNDLRRQQVYPEFPVWQESLLNPSCQRKDFHKTPLHYSATSHAEGLILPTFCRQLLGIPALDPEKGPGGKSPTMSRRLFT